jgi:hypothetical protein
MTVDQAVLERLISLFQLIEKGDYALASTYFAYRGPDKARELQAAANWADPLDRRHVESLCNRVRGWLDGSDNHEFGDFLTSETREGQWHAWEVTFHAGRNQTTRYFGFLSIGGTFLLGNIDR